MRQCQHCGSENVGTSIMGQSYEAVRKGAKRFDACRTCGHWAVSVATEDTSKEGLHWKIIDQGHEPWGKTPSQQARHP